MRVRAGVGDSAVKLDGGRIDRFEFEAGAGGVSIDLSGDWEADLDADGNSEVTLNIRITQGAGSVEIDD